MADRYFVEAPIAGNTVQLVGHEAHHLAHVMRAKPGQQVTVFDGSGAEFIATVSKVGRAEIDLELGAREEIDRELATAITLGVALPKGDRQRWLVEKATELGVASLVPVLTERGNDRESPSALAKLHRAVIEASKQCGRNRLMEIASPMPLADFLGSHAAGVRWFAHPGGKSLDVPRETITEVAIAVGPEGGYTAAEVTQADSAGWTAIGLGTRILRVETAALAIVSKIALV